ncbi:MAG: spore coat protein CotJB [Acetivibrio sp.]
MIRNDRQKLLLFITEVSFAVDDVVLYLDTHPEDKQAMEYYDTYRKLRKQALSEYTRLYGPLSDEDVNGGNCWTWVKDPWPWEVSGRGVCN